MQLSDWIEDIVGKGEIAHYKQFLLFPQCFQELSVVDVSKWISVELRVNSIGLQRKKYQSLPDWKHSQTHLKLKEFLVERVENIVGKVKKLVIGIFAFFFFLLSVFSKVLFVRVLKSQNCLVKGKKCWLQASSPFHTIFSQVLYVRVELLGKMKEKAQLFTKWQNFRLFQIEKFCRQQNKCDWKIENWFGEW